MTPATTYDQLVTDLYRAAVGDLPWGQPLEALRRQFDALAVHLHGLDPGTGAVSFSYEVGGYPAAAALAYIREYHRIDPRAALVAELPTGQWVSCHHEFTEDFVATNPFYQDFLIPYGGRWVSGAKVYQDDDLVAILGIHRGRGMQPLNDDEVALGRRLGGHVTQALGMWRRHGQQRPRHLLGAAVLEQLPHPVLLIDEQLQLHHANPVALERLADDARLRVQDGRLRFGRPQAQQELLMALRALRLGGAESYLHDSPEQTRVAVRVDDGSGRPPLALFITALRPTQTMGAFGPHTLAMAFVHDVGRPAEVDVFVAATLFDLTPAEAAVAVGVTRGRTPTQLAQDHDVSVTTIRSQLAAVFGKMGVKRQAELAGALAALPNWQR